MTLSLSERLAANAEAFRSLARRGRNVTLLANMIEALADDLEAGSREALNLELRIHLDAPRTPAAPPRRIKARERR